MLEISVLVVKTSLHALFIKRCSALFIIICVLCLSACDSNQSLSQFSSDGCSLFPDVSLINNDDWCECCVEHDIAYWQGGTEQQRQEADSKLKKCVIAKTQDTVLANIMYEGVRFGGSPYFYNWYRWGYGWSYERKYQPHTDSDKKQIQLQLGKYDSKDSSVCKH